MVPLEIWVNIEGHGELIDCLAKDSQELLMFVQILYKSCLVITETQ